MDRAISEVERVLELNPNSAADRERLDQLKHRPTTEPKPPTMLDILWERVKAVPQAALVAAAAVFVVVCLFVLFWPRGATPVVRTVQPPVSVGAPGEVQATAPQQPYTPSQPVTAPYPPAYRYTPPPAAVQPMTGAPQTTAARPMTSGTPPCRCGTLNEAGRAFTRLCPANTWSSMESTIWRCGSVSVTRRYMTIREARMVFLRSWPANHPEAVENEEA